MAGIPLYNTEERLKYRPSKVQDYGDGGAFPEIHHWQYPLDMGTRKKKDSFSGPKTLPVMQKPRVLEANNSPPVPVMHSLPRSLTVKGQQEWKIIPPYFKYTIRLDQEVQINDSLAMSDKALCVAEQRAREPVAGRSIALKEIMLKYFNVRKEQQLQAVAQKARSERTGTGTTIGCVGSLVSSEKKSRITRKRDRDISEDKQYNVYDNKGLVTEQPALFTLYKPKKDADVDEMYDWADKQFGKMIKQLKPVKGFSGAKSGPRCRPEEEEEEDDDEDEADPFGSGIIVVID